MGMFTYSSNVGLELKLVDFFSLVGLHLLQELYVDDHKHKTYQGLKKEVHVS
jgi:hypothetical protein